MSRQGERCHTVVLTPTDLNHGEFFDVAYEALRQLCAKDDLRPMDIRFDGEGSPAEINSAGLPANMRALKFSATGIPA